MTPPAPGRDERPDVPSAEPAISPYIGIGCLTFVSGFFGGGMIAALVAKGVGALQQCKPANELPACNLWSFVLPGALIGAVFLPTVAIRRLRAGRRDAARRAQP